MNGYNLYDIIDMCPHLMTMLNNNDKRNLGSTNKKLQKKLTPGLDVKVYNILKEIINHGWDIKINIEKKDNTGVLKKLYILSNLYKEEGLCIPEIIGELTSLTELVIREGWLWKFGRAPVTGTIPESICKLVNLEVLDANKTSLITKIPSDMCNLHKLRVLILLGNTITSDIPESFFIGEKGPLRSDDSYMYLWDSYEFGKGDIHTGSILNLNKEYRKTPYYEWAGEFMDGVSNMLPTRQSHMIRKTKTWYGSSYGY
jgi:hypothetical protein